jgi:tRNA-dihydrouridine synthase
VSVKTRIGYKEVVTNTWVPFLLSLGIDALTLHGRTAAEMSAVPAHWEEIGKAVQIRNALKSKTVIIGNGDVKDRADGLAKAGEYGVDGLMIGRGIFENLWAFDTGAHPTAGTTKELLPIMRKHVELYDATWGKDKNYATLRKFFKIYVKGFEGAGEWREKVMSTKAPEEVYPLIDQMEKMLE